MMLVTLCVLSVLILILIIALQPTLFAHLSTHFSYSLNGILPPNDAVLTPTTAISTSTAAHTPTIIKSMLHLVHSSSLPPQLPTNGVHPLTDAFHSLVNATRFAVGTSTGYQLHHPHTS